MVLSKKEINDLDFYGINDTLEILDIMEVLSNEKNVARITINNKKNINKILNIINKNNDIFNIKIKINKNIKEIETQGLKYQNKNLKIDETFYIYISKNIFDLIKSTKIRIDNPNDYEIGKYFGYPTCCINSLKNNVLNNKNIYYTLFSNSIDNNIFNVDLNLNVLSKWKIINYVPCSFLCKETILKLNSKKEKLKYIYESLENDLEFEDFFIKKNKFIIEINKIDFTFKKIKEVKYNTENNYYLFFN